MIKAVIQKFLAFRELQRRNLSLVKSVVFYGGLIMSATKAKPIFIICFFEQIFHSKKSLVLLNSAVLILSVAVQWWMHRDGSPRDRYKFCVQNEANRKILDLFEVNRRALEILNYTCIISLKILLSATCFSTGQNSWCLVPGFIFLFKRWCVWLLLALVCHSLSLSFHKHLR